MNAKNSNNLNKKKNDLSKIFIKEIELSFNIQNKYNDEKVNLKKKGSLINLNIYNNEKKEYSLNKDQRNKRNFGIDILRILAIFFIINHHIIYHGGILFKTKILSFNNSILIFLNTLFCSGVNIFGMISGFVGFHSHKYSNLIYLLFQTFFYNYWIAFLFQKTRPSIVKDLYHYLFPLFISDYWYFNAYFAMYFFLPLINVGIKNTNKREMEVFNLSLFLLFSCFNQIRHYSKRFRKDFFHFVNGFTYMWLIILYFFGSYFGKYKINFNPHAKFTKIFINSLLLFFITFLRSFLIIYKKIYNQNSNAMIVEYTSPSSVIISLIFINILSKLEINLKILQAIISFFSPLTYGIYLLHNHYLVRNFMIKNKYLWLLKSHSIVMIILELFQSLKIFIFCSFIDYIRLLIFKILRIKRICIIIPNLLEKIFDKFFLLIRLCC